MPGLEDCGCETRGLEECAAVGLGEEDEPERSRECDRFFWSGSGGFRAVVSGFVGFLIRKTCQSLLSVG